MNDTARPVTGPFARASWLNHATAWAHIHRAATFTEALSFRAWLKRCDVVGDDADLAVLFEDWADQHG